MADLAHRGVVQAQYIVASWHLRANSSAGEKGEAIQLLQSAMAQDYPPAMFSYAHLEMNGQGITQDRAGGQELMRKAAALGSLQANKLLANLFPNETEANPNPIDASHHLRLCGLAGDADCRLAMARLLLSHRGQDDTEYVHGLVWLELAAEAGSAEANRSLKNEHPDKEKQKEMKQYRSRMAAQ